MKDNEKLIVNSWEEVGDLMRELDEIDNDLTKRNAAKNEETAGLYDEINVICDKYSKGISKLEARKAELECAIDEYAYSQRKNMEQSTMVYQHGTVEVSKTPPALALRYKKDDDKSAAARIAAYFKGKKAQLARYIKSEPKMIKNNLKADIQSGKITEDTAKDLGLKVVADYSVKITLNAKAITE